MQLQEQVQTQQVADPPRFDPRPMHSQGEQVAPGVTMYGLPLPPQIQAERDAAQKAMVPSGNVVAELEALRNRQRQEQEHRRWIAHGDRITPSNLPYGVSTRDGQRCQRYFSQVFGSEYAHTTRYEDTTEYEDDHWLGARAQPPPGLGIQ